MIPIPNRIMIFVETVEELTPAQYAEYDQLLASGIHPGGGVCGYCRRMTDFSPWGRHNPSVCRICWVQMPEDWRKPGDAIASKPSRCSDRPHEPPRQGTAPQEPPQGPTGRDA